MSNLLEALIIEPATPATASVIWCHGLGATCHDFAGVIPDLHLPSNTLRFIFPQAPLKPVTINRGLTMPAWYDILALDREAKEDTAGIQQSASALWELIAGEKAKGIPYHRIILLGFSQGGALALYTALHFAHQLGGVAALSDYLLLSSAFSAQQNHPHKDIPIFMGHGLKDEIVPYAFGLAGCQQLKQLGYSVAFHTYPMEHSVCYPELQDLGKWMTLALHLSTNHNETTTGR